LSLEDTSTAQAAKRLDERIKENNKTKLLNIWAP
tara:strand:- start:175 stop:276 length:102 start_codon:yes stop_codon:yes gene_type:complete